MQMRRNYESTNKVTRITSLRAAAKDCATKGFPGFASVCEEQADLLQSELDYAAKQRMKAERVEIDTDPEFRLPNLRESGRVNGAVTGPRHTSTSIVEVRITSVAWLPLLPYPFEAVR